MHKLIVIGESQIGHLREALEWRIALLQQHEENSRSRNLIKEAEQFSFKAEALRSVIRELDEQPWKK